MTIKASQAYEIAQSANNHIDNVKEALSRIESVIINYARQGHTKANISIQHFKSVFELTETDLKNVYKVLSEAGYKVYPSEYGNALIIDWDTKTDWDTEAEKACTVCFGTKKVLPDIPPDMQGDMFGFCFHQRCPKCCESKR